MKITHLNAATGPVIKDRMKLVREGKMNRFEASHRLRSGEIRDVEVFSTPIKQGERVFLYSIIHDITERKKAEEQNKLLIESIEHSPVSVVITDPAGSIAYVNNKFTQVTGYTKEEALGNNPRILKSGRQTKEVYQEMWDKILSGQSWRGELQNKRKNGELYWEDAIITPLMNEEGRVTHFVAVKEDITEKKRMLEELIKAKEEAEEMNKIKSNFFANMSHELRTPLIGILGFSEILQAELEDNPELVYMAETINKGGNRLLETLNLILGLSKLEAGKLEYHNKKTDIVPVIGETCALFRPAALAKGLEMHFKADPDIIYCSLDKILLGNVLNNLINNAVKFTEKGEINVKAEAKNGSAVISIADTGIGIADEQKGIVWEEFRQGSEGLSRSYEGTGLGLTIAKKYTEIMGGSITMQSEKGKGTTFTIMFGLMKNE
ncbi:MAG: Sensor histidine kinase RcsC [Ignavibacteriaceae bacterium]|nr:Sensor histidine kinase RcsC [Ignavibacteriaceae bacterium]